jgi:poly(A) polymerase
LNARELAGRLARRVARDPLARTVRTTARREAVPVWLVGGVVRDTALGRPIHDLDLVAGPGATRLVRRLSELWGRRAFRFRRRGVTTWRWEARGRRIDLVDAARRGLAADLARRELTINAIAYDLDRGRLHDPLGGLVDLRRRRLALPRPAVMREDPVRALRAARFLAQLDGFRLAPRAKVEVLRAAGGLRRAAAERVREELDRLLGCAAPERGLEALVELGLLGAVLPELVPLRDCVAGGDRPDVWTHTVAVVAASARPGRWPGAAAIRDPDSRRVLRWSLLLHDVAKPETFAVAADGRPTFHGHEIAGAKRAVAILTRLRMPVRERRRVERLVACHLRPSLLAEAGAPPRGLRRLVREAGEDLPLLVLHAACDARGSGGPPDPARMRRLRGVLRQLLELHERSRLFPRPKLVDGRVLLERLALEEGPLVGRLLRAIEEAQDEGRVATAEQALALARAELERAGRESGP